MKQASRILDMLGDQVELLQARIEQLEAWEKRAREQFARFQTVADFVKGEPEEAATTDPVDAILAVMARWKQEAQIAVGRANDSGRIAQELQQQVIDLQARADGAGCCAGTNGRQPAAAGEPYGAD